VYWLADLRVRKRRSRKRLELELEGVPLHRCEAISEVCSLDFVSDRLVNGRRIESNGMDAPTFDGINVPELKCQQPLELEGASTMQITTIGIDLAQTVLQIHGADQREQQRPDRMQTGR
jgi:hypothetical protein